MKRSLGLLIFIVCLFALGALLPTIHSPLQWLPLLKGGRTSELDWNLEQIEKGRSNYRFVGIGDSRLRGFLNTSLWADGFSAKLNDILLLTHGGFGRGFQYQRLKYFYRFNRTEYLILPVHSREYSRTHLRYDRFATVVELLADPDVTKQLRAAITSTKVLFSMLPFVDGPWIPPNIRSAHYKSIRRVLLLSRNFRKDVDKDWSRLTRAAMRPYFHLIDLARSGGFYKADKEWHGKLNLGRGYFHSAGVTDKETQIQLKKIYARVTQNGRLKTSDFDIEKDGGRGPHYLRKMIRLGQRNGSKIIFLFIPSLGGTRFSARTIRKFRKLGFYNEPKDLFDLQHTVNWSDLHHISKETGISLTREMIRSLRAQGVR